MSSFAVKARSPTLTFRHLVIGSCVVKAEAFLDQNLPSLTWLGDFITFMCPVVSAVAMNTCTQTYVPLLGVVDWVMRGSSGRMGVLVLVSRFDR